MASNVLYIGLGGTGVKTVANVRKLYAEHLRAGRPSYKAEFLLVDTDTGDTKASLLKDFAGEFALDQRFIDFDTDWVDLGSFNPAATWREIQRSSLQKDVDIKAWINAEQADRFDDKIITIGADANRQLGRLCFAQKIEALRKAVGQKFDALIDKHAEGARTLQIMIVTSSCGGTGSSVFFDVCYLVSAIAYPRLNALPQIRGIIAAPGGYLEAMKNAQMGAELISRVKANAYAYFVELDDAMKGTGPQRQSFALPSDVDVKTFQAKWRPFQAAGVVDVQMEGTASFINLKELPKVVGESLFYLHSASGDERLDGVFTNLGKSDSEYFFSLGLKTLAYPSQELGDYLSARFFYDVLGDRFLATSAPEKDLNERADKIFTGLSTSFDNARNETWRGLINSVLDRTTIEDRVLRVDGKGNEEIDPALVTAEVLEQWHSELKHAIDELKRGIQRAFGDWAGQAKLGDGGAFAQSRDMLRVTMSDCIEKWGVSAWVGWRGETDRPGLATRVMERGGAQEKQLRSNLIQSSQHTVSLRNTLSSTRTSLVEAQQERGFFKNKKAEIRELIGRLEQTRRDLIEEEFRNECLKREVEFVSWVASPDRIEAEDIFTRKPAPSGEYSITKDILEQGLRIRTWIADAYERARKDLNATVETLSKSSEFLVFDPPLAGAVATAGSPPSGITSKPLAILNGLARNESSLLNRFTGKYTWADVRRTEVESSENVFKDLQAGSRAWVLQQLRAPEQPELSSVSLRSLEEHLKDMTDAHRQELRTRMGIESVKVLSPVKDSVPASKPTFRIIVAPDDGNRPDGVAQMLGYKTGDAAQAVLPGSSPQRATAIKMYHHLALSDFPWFDGLKSEYDDRLDYEMHLMRDYRTRRLVKGGEHRTERAFAVSMMWAATLKQKLRTDLMDYFTKRLEFQEADYLHEGAIALREGNAIYLLRTDIKATGKVNEADARLECPMADLRFDKIAEARQFHHAYSAFVKTETTIRNAEWLHDLFSGVSTSWNEAGESALTLTNDGRAAKFVEFAGEFVKALQALHGQLKTHQAKTVATEAIISVTGRMISSLGEEIARFEGVRTPQGAITI